MLNMILHELSFYNHTLIFLILLSRLSDCIERITKTRTRTGSEDCDESESRFLREEIFYVIQTLIIIKSQTRVDVKLTLTISSVITSVPRIIS